MANPAPPSVLHEAARRIVEQETGGSLEPARVAAGVESALRGLQVAFANVIGPAGFEGVLTRAMYLARPSFAWLQRTELVVQPAVTLVDLAATAQCEGPEKVKAGAVLVVATFASLLATFIGEELTLSVLRGRWGSLPGPGLGAKGRPLHGRG
jgi:hypothetical protein